MSASRGEFGPRIARARPTRDEVAVRRWVYVPYDRLTADVGPLAGADPAEVGAIFVESTEEAQRRPYHKKKLALLLANERHVALDRARGPARPRGARCGGPALQPVPPRRAALILAGPVGHWSHERRART